MSLYLICGAPGAGKSQVCIKLKQKGYEAYDSDDDGFARWRHENTGYVHPKSSVKPHQRTPEFLKNHQWIVQRKSVEELMDDSSNKPIFFCGTFANEDELRDLFSAVFYLYTDDKTLEDRLLTRTSNNWGKQKHEMEISLAKNRSEYEKHTRMSDFIIDASQPIESVAAEILRNINARQ